MNGTIISTSLLLIRKIEFQDVFNLLNLRFNRYMFKVGYNFVT